MKALLRNRRDLLKRYGLALGSAALALLIRGSLPIRPGLGIYQLALAAVVVSAWYGGRGPGLFALVISAAGILYWLIPPADSFTLPTEYALTLGLFLTLGVVLIEFSVGRRRVEHALEESEGRFRLMAETVPEILWIESIEPRGALYVSSRYEQIWGRPVSDLYRDPNLWLEAIHPEDRSHVVSTYMRWLAGEGRFDMEFRIVRPDGGTRWIHSRGTLIRSEQGRPYRASGIAEDITDARRVHWLAAEPPNLDQARETATRIVKDANRAAEVIAKVRALTRKSPGRKDWVDINETIGEVITLTRAEAQKSRVALQARLSPDVPPVLGDRVQLQQVLLNLIVNAIEAMSGAADGPRDLVVGSTREVSNGVLVTVRDCGAGLSAASPERMFDAFYTTKPGGMGMGLAISRSIIESHGGRIWATPNTPRGAVFQFTLPIAANAPSS